MTDGVRASHGERRFSKLLRAWRWSSPERDEAEAQEYWRRRFREHPEELTHSLRTRQIRVAEPIERAASAARQTGATRQGWRVIALWMNVAFAVLQGAATLVLFILGASSDKIVLGVSWTALWSFQAGIFFLRYG